jgi:hypothetical protein
MLNQLHIRPTNHSRTLAPVLIGFVVAGWPTICLADFGFPPPSNLTTTEGILRGVIVTLAVELALVAGYCYWRKIPMARCLYAGLLGNALTLPVVWFCSVMGWFFLAFLGVIVFVIVELLAGLIESVLYKLIGRLEWRRALTLGLAVNLVTMVMGLIDQAVHFQTRPGPPRRPPSASIEVPSDANVPDVRIRYVPGTFSMMGC